MTKKEEALLKLKELQEYIDTLDNEEKQEQIIEGMIYKFWDTHEDVFSFDYLEEIRNKRYISAKSK